MESVQNTLTSALIRMHRQYLQILEILIDDQPCDAYMLFPRLGVVRVYGIFPGAMQKITIKYIRRTRRRKTYFIEIFCAYQPSDYATIYLRHHLAKGLVNNLVAPTEKSR